MSILEQLPKVRGRYKENVELSKFSWFRVGGIGDVLYTPADSADLSEFLQAIDSNIPIHVIGAGSNIVIRDNGIRGVIIRLGRNFNYVQVKDDLLIAGAATLDLNVAEFAAQSGYSGLEFLSGIPGTIGGAVFMNAGAYDCDISERLHSATVNDMKGKILRLNNSDFAYAYRSNALSSPVIITEACFHIKKGDQTQILEKIANIKLSRNKSQPIKSHTGGSTFKNPLDEKNKKAWQLIEGIKCRGMRIGQIKVSELHCNFLVNLGGGNAQDIENIIDILQQKVLDKYNIQLELELKILGEK